MKKIININLSGRVIPIEDSAYEKLQQYIESLRRYFANEEGRDEIINDIEGRIAELMSDTVRKGAESITDNDVEDIINSMGRVEDFEAADQETGSASAGNAGPASSAREQSNAYTAPPKKEKGRLYRDTNDKFIGGVCSGIAAYLNFDPAIVRILFAIITFGGFGFGFLAYIILWMVLPPKDLEGFVGKRLYRNPDDKIIGGVAGGLAAYFGKSANAIRLVFVAPLLFSIFIGVINSITRDFDFDVAWNIGFGSLTGTFILAYIILWMVLPEAVSDYQKMEMRGETVDINRIRQNVREGIDSMKEKMKEWGNEVKTSAQNFSARANEFAGTRGKEFAREFGETTRRGGQGLGHVIGVIFKVFFLFIAGTIAFGLFVAVIALLFGGVAWWPINDFLWTSSWQQAMAWATLVLFLLVPLIGFIVWVIRRVTRVKSKSNYLGWTFGGLWALGWVAMIFFVSSIVRDFRQYEHTETAVTVTQPARGKMIVAVSQPGLEYTGGFGWMRDGGNGWDLSSDTLKIGAVSFDVKASVDEQYHVTVRKYSFGRTNSEASARAGKILFDVVSKDSVLDIGNGYVIDKGSKFRGQNVEVEILVPVGKKIRFDESVSRKLNSIHVKVKRSDRRNRITGLEINGDDEFEYRTGIDYLMGSNGELTGPGGEKAGPGPNHEYRYSPANDSALNKTDEEKIRKQLEEEKRKKEESDKKIKDLEEKLKTSKPGTGIQKREPGKAKGAFAFGASPVTAITQWF
jgi:phage shock protein PspC (stress-responsive transcriptional regulator)